MADSTTPQTEHIPAEKPVTPTSVGTSENEKGVLEKNTVAEDVVPHSGIEDYGDVQPHIHLKTYLAVFAVFMIYAAQLYAIVGAGTVSRWLSKLRLQLRC
jgi:hypothetical protein